MFAKTVLLGLAAIACLAETKDLKECGKIFIPPSEKCCKDNSLKMHISESMSECFKTFKPPPPSSGESGPPPCDLEKCLAEKKGFLNADGTLNKDAMKRTTQMHMASKPALVKKVIDNCLDGDLSQYAPADFCEHIKLKNCIIVQSFSECEDWDGDRPECVELKQLIEKCES